MTNSTSDHEQAFQVRSVTINEFALALKTARETHRQIVPIVGAGLSADSGFPVITAIVRYFGKLYRYIEQKGPLRRGDVPEIKYLENLFEEYREKPWRFVEDFGWPDRFQLNQDLYASLLEDDPKLTPERSVEKAVRDGLDSVLPLVNQSGLRAYRDLRKEIIAKLEEVKRNLAGDKKADAIAALEKAQDRLNKNWSRSSAFDIVGDWRRLILSFTNYRSDYADALFARFGSTRQPGQGHRFLAFLIRFLAVPTVFTFNFDSLIEQALESEGDRPRVFAMERGAALPHARLVRDHLSVIKMHGSTHALLLDEQLDRPLSDEYLQRFGQITGSNPLLLVVGCSDGDQRLRDLVSAVVKGSSPGTPCVLWLHYEDESPQFLDKLLSKGGAATREKILTCPTNNPGATLQHLYSWLTGCHPAGNLPYIAHIQQPVHGGTKVNAQGTPDSWPKKNRFTLISSLSKQNPIPSASHELLKRANYWTRYGYSFIWIDLEAVHTFAGVVGAIIDQCRKYDPDLAPSVLPVDIDRLGSEGKDGDFLNAAIDLAVNRVARALRRTRYYLALDGLETYVWPASTHHGLSHMAMQNDANARLRNLGEFLKRLVGSKEELGESIVGISVDRPISRHDSDLSDYLELDEVVSELDKVSDHSNPFPEDADEFKFDDHFEYLATDLPLVSPKPVGVFSGVDDKRKARLALILFNLSCFRRMRPLVSVRHLIEPLLDDKDRRGEDTVERILQQFVDEWDGEVLQQLEGGGYWFTRTIRNKVYAEDTTFTDTGDIGICLTGRNRHDETVSTEERVRLCRNSAFQLCLAAMTHQRIARTWYTRTFVQSQDTFSFLEYTYHRISSVRSLVKLRRLVQVASKETVIAEAVLGGIEAWIDLNEKVHTHGNSKQPEFENDDFIRELPDLSANSRRSDAATLLDDIEAALRKRHGDELGSLYRAWTRSEVPLRTQIPAEQLLHWCRELLTDDLRHRCNRAVIGYRKRPESENQFDYELEYHKLTREDGQSDELIDPDIEDGVIKEFRQYLQDLQAKLWIERSDYETCIRARWRHLLDAAEVEMRDRMIRKHNLSTEGPVGTKAAEDLEQDDEFIASCDEAQCHRLLDIVNCRFQWKLEFCFYDADIAEAREAPWQLLERVEKQLKAREADKRRTSKPAEVNNLNEAWLRLLHLQAENQMGRITVFTHDGFTADPNKWKPESLDLVEVRKTISAGLERIKTHDSRTHQAPRSVLLDPTTDGALYLQYRSVFYLLKGRTEWLSSDAAFDKAQWCFEMARGGLGNHSPLMMALIELYAVEALLGRARKELRFAASDKDAIEACDRARGLYDSARGGLQRARESLLASRRNVIWRKFFFRLTTQYHSDRLLLGYALLKPLVEKLNAPKISEEVKKKSRQSCEELLRHFLLRLRRAYQSLLTAVDLYLPQSFDQQNADPCPNRFRWLYRMWWELTLCGYATGRLALSLDSNTDPLDADRFVTRQLQWLNETGGIEASELGKLIKGKYGLLTTHYGEIGSNSNNSRGAQRALEERHAIITRAMRAADRDE